MEAHQRNLYLYERYNTRVAGVSRDTIPTLKYWTEDLGLTFPIFSNPVGHLGIWFGSLEEGYPMFRRRTIIIDKYGVIRYGQNGTPDFREILLTIKQLHEEEDK